MFNKLKLKKQRGVVLASLMISTLLIFAIVLIVSQTVVDNYKVVLGEQHRVSAQFAADAGVDYAITQLNTDGDWDGTAGTEVDLATVAGEYKTTFEVTVSDESEIATLPEGHIQLDVTGYTYFPDTSAEPKESRSLIVELYPVAGGSSGGASVVTGVGGLELTNSAKIVAGNVYVNGTIRMTNSAQIGTTLTPVDVRVAHQSCPIPANATFPQVCGAGNGQPITMTNSSHIYGDVQATNQTSGPAMTNPGLVAGTPAPLPLPTHDRAAQIAAVSNTMTSAQASCSSGTKNIPANTQVTGNVNWSNSCDVTINGDFYVTGNLQMSNSAEATVAESVGTDRPDIMVDGSTGFRMSNSTEMIANSFDTGVQIVTYRSAAACSPNCADVTGVDLYNSRNIVTIELNNNASAPETIFFAKWSQVNIVNAGDIGALVGQTVRLNNSAAVVFGASVTGFGGSPPTYLVHSYRQS